MANQLITNFIVTLMILSLNFISSKSGKAVTLKVQEKTYLFNIFEGFQRYAIQEHISLVSIDSLFLTSKASIPGLMGAYLTLSDSKKYNMDIVSTFDPLFFSIYKFHLSKSLKLNFISSYADKYISVEMFDLQNVTNFIVKLPKVDGSIRANEIPKVIPKESYKYFVYDGQITVDGITYDLSLYRDSGIQLNKIALIFSEIDQDVTEEVRELLKDVKCIFCFTKSSWNYFSKAGLGNLTDNANSAGVSTSADNANSAGVSTSADNAHPRNKDNFEGLFYVSDNNFIEFKDFYEKQLHLRSTNRSLLLPYSNVLKKPSAVSNYTIQPGDKLHYTKKIGVYMTRGENSVPEIANYVALCPSIEFLGTGCAIPSKDRNVSAILYQNRNSAILLDCGEDTLTQIQRLHGSLDVLERLKIVYISHHHADHLLGIAAVVRNAPNPILIIAPSYTREYLAYFGVNSTVISMESTVTLADQVGFIETDFLKARESDFYSDGSPENTDISKYVQKTVFNEFEIVICGCTHSTSSTSVAITDRTVGKKFSYSGDTMPSVLFAMMASESDVMIHEATFEAALVDEARRRQHTTVDEANEIFRLSKSRKLLLTHFSNRSEVGEGDGCNARDFYRYEFN